jgi:hypothetical protein
MFSGDTTAFSFLTHEDVSSGEIGGIVGLTGEISQAHHQPTTITAQGNASRFKLLVSSS